jgi:predicted transcriptional regulator
MMSSLTELTALIITARAAKNEMSTEEFQQEMKMIYSLLKGVEDGSAQAPVAVPVPQKINFMQYFKKDVVICLICNKGFKTLKRHLAIAHDLKPSAYRKQFNIPAKFNLVATAYSEQRKKDALDRGQGEILAKARAVRAAKNAKPVAVVAPVAPAAKTKAPSVKAKAQVPAVRVKTPVPTVRIKAAVPAKVAKKK